MHYLKKLCLDRAGHEPSGPLDIASSALTTDWATEERLINSACIASAKNLHFNTMHKILENVVNFWKCGKFFWVWTKSCGKKSLHRSWLQLSKFFGTFLNWEGKLSDDSSIWCVDLSIDCVSYTDQLLPM